MATATKEPVVTEVPDRDGNVITGKDKEHDMARIAHEEESRRDMVDRIAGIDAADQAEIMFADTSPPRPLTVLYATLDGEPVIVTRKRARLLLQRKLPDGKYMFIAPLEDGSPPPSVPEYRLGSVKCFMHKESEERKLLDSLGMAGKLCIAGHLANVYAKRIHERKCHKREREMYQDYLDDKKEAASIERQEMQYTAMMALAGKAAAPEKAKPAKNVTTCHSCNEVIEGKLKDHHCDV